MFPFGSSNKQKKLAQKRLEQANIRTALGADVSDDSVIVNAPPMKTAGEAAWGMAKDVLQTIISIVVYILTFIGAVSLVYPGPRAALYEILTSAFSVLKNLV